MSSGPLQKMKTLALKAVNAIPVSSTVIGHPRRMANAAALNFKESQSGYRVVRKAEEINETPPLSIDDEVFFKYDNFYHRIAPEQFILKLANGRIWGRNGAVITADDIFVADVSREFGVAKFDSSKHSIFRRLKLKKPIEIDESVAVIAAPGGNVYAHWLCDIMPRLMMLKKEGVLDKVDKIIMSFSWLNYQKETLNLLGIEQSKIINSFDDSEFHLRAKTVYVPSYPNLVGTVNHWVCNEISNIFLDKSKLSERKDRLYVSRAKAIGRQVANEDEVFAFLEKEYGFKKIFSEDYSTTETAKLFYNAECIIGPHGGGFTNLLFCAEGCKVIDMFPPSDFTTMFWVLANANRLQYAYFFGEGEMPTKEKDIIERNVSIDVNINKLQLLLRKLNIAKP